MVKKAEQQIGDWHVLLEDTKVTVTFKGELTHYGRDFYINKLTRQEALIKAEAHFRDCINSFTQMENHFQRAMQYPGTDARFGV